MEELQVPTRRITVDAFLSGGERLRGSLYLSESPYHKPIPQDVSAILNDDRTFLPFTTDEPDHAALLNKCHVLRVHLGHDVADQESLDPSTAAPCTLLLDDGTCLTGKVAIATPLACSRLVDKLNQATGFVPVITTHGIDFVHTMHVVRVR
jgi:hypothetical protein